MQDLVQSVDRSLDILEILSQNIDGLSITEISQKADLHKSTAHRLLKTLRYKGYVQQDDQTNKYELSLKLFELGSKKIEGLDLLSQSKSHTQALSEKLNEVVHLVIRDGNDIVYIDKVEADNTIRMTSSIGRRLPLYQTSVGKAILAQLSLEEVEKVWQASQIEKKTPNTITSWPDFLIELDKVRQAGYAIDNEENELGVRCLGAAIFNHRGEVEGAISVSGPTFRVSLDKLDTIASAVKEEADNISRELGYRRP